MPSSILQKFRNIGRLTHIVNILARYGFKREIQRTELRDLIQSQTNDSSLHEQHMNTPHSIAKRLAMAFEELGPTFVKLAQILAAREDLLPKNYVEEFKRLHDRVKPLPKEVVEKCLIDEFSEDILAEIEDFDYVPIGSASIGQVHRALLKDGRHVVFKIQRPDINIIISNDLAILMTIASILETAMPELRLLRPTVIIEELRRSLLNELDYLREASNTERMRAFFKDHKNIEIPQIFYKYCTSKILCMSEIKGTKLTGKLEIKNTKSLARLGVEAFLDMTFKFGVFHGDLHPGNFILMDNGKLAIIDFGLTVRLKRDIRNTMAFMFYSLSKQDIETCARLFIDLTENDDLTSNDQLESEITEILDNIITLPAQEMHLGKVLMRIAKVSARKGAPLERELILFFRALIALENFGRSMDAKFQILEFSTEYAEKNALFHFDKKWFERNISLAMHDSGAFIKDLPITLRILAKKLQTGSLAFQFKSEDIIFLTREIDRASNRLSLAILIGSIVLGSSIATYGKQGRLYDSLATFGLIGFGIALVLGLWLILGIIRSGRFK
ncbi:ABC1 kinase family protein [Fluviispira sanaruensis]|uniref:Ubiquinone biosynthesis protein n=1 Tax=Fluviispira sanaruensis TaxID=2493639 RepID=A0A4P2VLB9_FLUSA|nr:AarF/UbiB family protein [Fluviispira sanaruensis]BBH53641.1 ubiquinone biosynthesis protein [Fluviispira sanaruensis]